MRVFKSITLAFAGAVTSVALAAAPVQLSEQVTQLNQEIVSILAPFQNQSTKAELLFSKIRTDAKRALRMTVSGLYMKAGAKTTLTVKADEISYKYGFGGRRPTTRVKGSVAVDLTKLMPAADLNSLFDSLEQIIPQYAADFTKRYGQAVTVAAKVSDKVITKDGNYQSLRLHLDVNFDLSKLPADKPVTDVMMKSIRADIYLTAATGAIVNVKVVSNPKYKAFQDDQQGLKDILDKLLNKDPDQLKSIENMFRQIDDMVSGVLN